MRLITLQNALLGHLEITVAENVDIVWTDVITSMEAAYMDVYKDTEENSANIVNVFSFTIFFLNKRFMSHIAHLNNGFSYHSISVLNSPS